MTAPDHAAAKVLAEAIVAHPFYLAFTAPHQLARAYLALLSWAEREDVHAQGCDWWINCEPPCTCKPRRSEPAPKEGA